MHHIDLFSGIGGMALAAKWTWGDEYENVGHSEVEAYPCKVYHRHFPESECLGDITKIEWKEGQADLITGGFPCQPHSVAGKRKGSGDKRDLWGECVRALSGVRPQYAVFENVPGIITSEFGFTWERIKVDLEACGYEGLPVLLSAANVGAKHKRLRVWIVAHDALGADGAHNRGTEERSEQKPRKSVSRKALADTKGAERQWYWGTRRRWTELTNRSLLPDWSGGEMGQPWPVTEFERPDGEANEIVDDPKSIRRGRMGHSKNKRATDGGLNTPDNASEGDGEAMGDPGRSGLEGESRRRSGKESTNGHPRNGKAKLREVERVFCRVVTRLPINVDDGGLSGTPKEEGADKMLLKLWRGTREEEIRREIGRLLGIPPSKILWARLYENWDGEEQRRSVGSQVEGGESNREKEVRGVRHNKGFARTPQRQGHREQRTDEFGGSLFIPSSQIALAGGLQATLTVHLAVEERVCRLRGLGNSIVPQVAQVIFEAIKRTMEQ